MKMEFLELKYRLLSLLVLAESKLKSWIIKYGRRESVELLLQNYIVSLSATLIEKSEAPGTHHLTPSSLFGTVILILNLNIKVPVC